MPRRAKCRTLRGENIRSRRDGAADLGKNVDRSLFSQVPVDLTLPTAVSVLGRRSDESSAQGLRFYRKHVPP
ncbi:hypothetical protein J6590_043242 [Homalodisca vitripennis]|nr:hypothetical protein J6590_043242 [Homalodisca vitripennis]